MTIGQKPGSALEGDNALSGFGANDPIGGADIVSAAVEEALQFFAL